MNAAPSRSPDKQPDNDLARPARGPIVVLGPTASGKSALAIALARRNPGTELLAVDSMQVYRGMDIGTASPTPAEQAEVPHHLIDLVDPDDDFDLAQFQSAARDALADIAGRNGTAVLVGGTALYLRAIVDDLEMPGQFPEARAEIEQEPDSALLHARLVELDPTAASRIDPANRRRVVRALEVTVGSGRRFSDFGPGLSQHPPSPFRQIGLHWDLADLDERIAARYRQQLDDGFLTEVERLVAANITLSRTATQALGYRELADHLRGACSLEAAVDNAILRTRRFARRQLKWFRRDPRITWFDGDDPGLVERVEAWIVRGDHGIDTAE